MRGWFPPPLLRAFTTGMSSLRNWRFLMSRSSDVRVSKASRCGLRDGPGRKGWPPSRLTKKGCTAGAVAAYEGARDDVRAVTHVGLAILKSIHQAEPQEAAIGIEGAIEFGDSYPDMSYPRDA